ncbi:hypothetical protein Chls_785 [Chlamydia suis]|uniref:Uncharacterized protein n=1 Tax=Chlamydia suis TaxID=83559 RepID=A0ABX6ITJ9_9CHLA|nr:hypothetical protein Chls_785 [Chlamydia suis]
MIARFSQEICKIFEGGQCLLIYCFNVSFYLVCDESGEFAIFLSLPPFSSLVSRNCKKIYKGLFQK